MQPTKTVAPPQKKKYLLPLPPPPPRILSNVASLITKQC